MERRPKNIPLQHVALYLDSVARDRLERSASSRREGELLALKDKLLRLEEPEFEAAIKTLRRFVAEAPERAESPEDKARRKYREAARLFNEAQESVGSATAQGKVEPVR